MTGPPLITAPRGWSRLPPWCASDRPNWANHLRRGLLDNVTKTRPFTARVASCYHALHPRIILYIWPNIRSTFSHGSCENCIMDAPPVVCRKRNFFPRCRGRCVKKQRNPKCNTKLNPNPNCNPKTNPIPKTNPNPDLQNTVEKVLKTLKIMIAG